MTVMAEVYQALILVGEVKHWGEWEVTSIIESQFSIRRDSCV
jgi:lipopolysaccharide transport system permease protein